MPPPIIIVGAGLAGLTLSRSLKQYGIPAVVLEKTAFLPRHNYRINLHPWALQPLCDILNMDEKFFRKSMVIDAVHRRRGKGSDGATVPKTNTDAGSFRCHRGRLDHRLLEGQEISWNHDVHSVTTSSKGVTVHLEDGNQLHGKLLIGADGVHSHVRKSLAPEMRLEVLPYVVYNGKRRCTKAGYQGYFADSLQDQTVLRACRGDIILEMSINNYSDKQVEVSYTYSRPARDNDPLYRPNRQTSQANHIPEDFYDELENLEDLQQPFNIIFDPGEVRKDRVTHWLMRSSRSDRAQIKRLAKQGVLLLGDAVHAMPILGGQGANHAIKDGVDLARFLSRHGTDNLQDFTDAMYETWGRSVEQSTARLARMHNSARASL